jgi:hypothetical protein
MIVSPSERANKQSHAVGVDLDCRSWLEGYFVCAFIEVRPLEVLQLNGTIPWHQEWLQIWKIAFDSFRFLCLLINVLVQSYYAKSFT